MARTFLRRTGWRVLERGYRLGRREIDIIAGRENTLAFVEVKTRSGLGYGAPEDAITRRKRREIEAVAQDYLLRHVDPNRDVDVRFDVVAVLVGPDGRLLRCEHLEDAWRPE